MPKSSHPPPRQGRPSPAHGRGAVCRAGGQRNRRRADRRQPEEEKTDKDLLQGKWMFPAFELDGILFTAAALKRSIVAQLCDLRATVKDDGVSSSTAALRPGQTLMLALDPAEKPPTLDLQ